MDSLLPEIQQIFRDVLDQPDLVIDRESNPSTIDNWDSLAHVDLITAIQMRFKVKFALGELERLKNVGDLIDLTQKKIETMRFHVY